MSTIYYSARIILFASIIFLVISEEDKCKYTSHAKSDIVENLVNGRNAINDYLSGKPADGTAIEMGVTSCFAIMTSTVSSVPVIGQFVAPIASLFDKLAPKKTSQELECMTQEFKNLNKRLDAIDAALRGFNSRIDEVIKQIRSESTRGIAQQLFVQYNNNKARIDEIKAIYKLLILDFNGNGRKEDLLDSCRIHNPFVRLNWIKNFIFRDSPGDDFLPMVYEASNCNSDFILTIASMIANDIKEIVYFDRLCEKIRRRRSKKIEREVQKMIEEIRDQLFATNLRIGECIMKDFDWSNIPNIKDRTDAMQNTADTIYTALKQKHGAGWFFSVFVFFHHYPFEHLPVLYHTIHNQTRAKHSLHHKNHVLIAWKHESENTDFWKTIDANAGVDGAIPMSMIACSEGVDVKSFEQIPKFIGEEQRNLIASVGGVSHSWLASDLEFHHPHAFTKMDPQIARRYDYKCPIQYLNDKRWSIQFVYMLAFF